MFYKRNYEPEIMDDFSIQDVRIDQALKELSIINKFLGGRTTTKAGLKKVFKQIPSRANLKILDAGSGASDVLISSVISKNNVKIFCLDRNKRICKYVKENIPELEIACGDANLFPFKEKEFDIVHASLFLHHFNEEEIKKLLVIFMASGKYALIINDLRRSVFALAGIKILTSLFSRNEFVKNDGPLSVRKGFIKSELLKIIGSIPINHFVIKRKWAFRWLIIIYNRIEEFPR